MALEALTARTDAHEQAATLTAHPRPLRGRLNAFPRLVRPDGHRALPAEVAMLRLYLTDLDAARDPQGRRLYQPATLARRLAAIAARYKDAGLLAPTRNPRVRAVTGFVS